MKKDKGFKNKVKRSKYEYVEKVDEFTGLVFHCPNCNEVFHLHIATVRLVERWSLMDKVEVTKLEDILIPFTSDDDMIKQIRKQTLKEVLDLIDKEKDKYQAVSKITAHVIECVMENLKKEIKKLGDDWCWKRRAKKKLIKLIN